jgi:hypothetical protein
MRRKSVCVFLSAFVCVCWLVGRWVEEDARIRKLIDKEINVYAVDISRSPMVNIVSLI